MKCPAPARSGSERLPQRQRRRDPEGWKPIPPDRTKHVPRESGRCCESAHLKAAVASSTDFTDSTDGLEPDAPPHRCFPVTRRLKQPPPSTGFQSVESVQSVDPTASFQVNNHALSSQRPCAPAGNRPPPATRLRVSQSPCHPSVAPSGVPIPVVPRLTSWTTFCRCSAPPILADLHASGYCHPDR